jgi:hypothetical protein
LASRALEVLEEAYFRIGSALFTFPDETITVVLYTQQQFRDITNAPAWAAAAYDGRIRVPIRGALEKPEELRRVLSHELTHAIVQTIAPRHIPSWLHEGLSGIFEPHGVERARAVLTRFPERVPFAKFERGFHALSSDEARLAYAQSTVIVQQLVDESGGPALVSILQDLDKGVPFSQAYQDRLFMSFELFLERLQALR